MQANDDQSIGCASIARRSYMRRVLLLMSLVTVLGVGVACAMQPTVPTYPSPSDSITSTSTPPSQTPTTIPAPPWPPVGSTPTAPVTRSFGADSGVSVDFGLTNDADTQSILAAYPKPWSINDNSVTCDATVVTITWGKQDTSLMSVTKSWNGGLLQYTQVDFGVTTPELLAAQIAAAASTPCV